MIEGFDSNEEQSVVDTSKARVWTDTPGALHTWCYNMSHYVKYLPTMVSPHFHCSSFFVMATKLSKFVGKVAEQAAAEAVAKQAATRRNNALLATGLCGFIGYAFTHQRFFFFLVLMAFSCSFVYYRTVTALVRDDFSEVDIEEVRHRLDQRALQRQQLLDKSKQ
jgi:Ca2+-dependent lipid-binding protein